MLHDTVCLSWISCGLDIRATRPESKDHSRNRGWKNIIHGQKVIDHNFKRAGQIWCSPFDCFVAFESPHYLPLHFARSAHSCEGQRIDNMKFLLVIEHRQNCTIKNLLLRMWTMKKYQFKMIDISLCKKVSFDIIIFRGRFHTWIMPAL